MSDQIHKYMTKTRLLAEIDRLQTLLEIQTESLIKDKRFLIAQRDRALKELQIFIPAEKWVKIKNYIMGETSSVG